MKKLILTLLTVVSTTLFAQSRPTGTSITVYSPNPTFDNAPGYIQPKYKHFSPGFYLGAGGVIDEPMNQRVVGSIMIVGDNSTATSFSASFNNMTDKMEYTIIFYVKMF